MLGAWDMSLGGGKIESKYLDIIFSWNKVINGHDL